MFVLEKFNLLSFSDFYLNRWDTWSHPRYWNVFMFILMVALVVLYVLRSERDPQLFISADNLYLWRSTRLQSTCSLTHWCSSSGAFDWTRTCGMLREPQLMWIFTSQFWLRIIVVSSIFNIGFKDVKGMHVIISWLAPSKELCGADCRSLLCNRGEVRDCDIVRTVREMNLTSRFAGFYLLHRGIALKGFERLKTLQAFITWSQPHKKSFTKNFRLSMKRTCWNLCRHRSNLLLVPWPPWPPWPLRLHFSSSGIDGILAFFFNYVARSSELALSACFSHKSLGAWVSVSKRMSRMVVFDDAHAMIGSD